MEKALELYHHYLDRIIAWYNGLEQLYQYGVFFLAIVVSLFIAGYFILSRITR